MVHSSVAISWWSDSLALTCPSRLVALALGHNLCVRQTGRSEVVIPYVAEFIPKCVKELPSCVHLLADSDAVRKYVAKGSLRDRVRAWSPDHVTFPQPPHKSQLRRADALFSNRDGCLFTHHLKPGSGTMQPVSWLSCICWYLGLSWFDTIGFESKADSHLPTLDHHHGDLTLPREDTPEVFS